MDSTALDLALPNHHTVAQIPFPRVPFSESPTLSSRVPFTHSQQNVSFDLTRPSTLLTLPILLQPSLLTFPCSFLDPVQTLWLIMVVSTLHSPTHPPATPPANLWDECIHLPALCLREGSVARMKPPGAGGRISVIFLAAISNGRITSTLLP